MGIIIIVPTSKVFGGFDKIHKDFGVVLGSLLSTLYMLLFLFFLSPLASFYPELPSFFLYAAIYKTGISNYLSSKVYSSSKTQ